MESNKEKKASQRIWADDDLPCIWMEAGLIDFKLCHRQRNCDGCIMDAAMKGGDSVGSSSENDGQAEDSGSQKTKEQDGHPSPNHNSFKENSFSLLDPTAYYDRQFWKYKPADIHNVLIGLNDVVTSYLPPVRIRMAPVGQKVKRGEPYMWLVAFEGTITLLSPINGTVLWINHNMSLYIRKQSIRDHNRAWLMKMSTRELGCRIDGFLTGQRAERFLRQQEHELNDSLKNAESSSNIGVTLQDGGKPIMDFQRYRYPQKYFNIIQKFFRAWEVQ